MTQAGINRSSIGTGVLLAKTALAKCGHGPVRIVDRHGKEITVNSFSKTQQRRMKVNAKYARECLHELGTALTQWMYQPHRDSNTDALATFSNAKIVSLLHDLAHTERKLIADIGEGGQNVPIYESAKNSLYDTLLYTINNTERSLGNLNIDSASLGEGGSVDGSDKMRRRRDDEHIIASLPHDVATVLNLRGFLKLDKTFRFPLDEHRKSNLTALSKYLTNISNMLLQGSINLHLGGIDETSNFTAEPQRMRALNNLSQKNIASYIKNIDNVNRAWGNERNAGVAFSTLLTGSRESSSLTDRPVYIMVETSPFNLHGPGDLPQDMCGKDDGATTRAVSYLAKHFNNAAVAVGYRVDSDGGNGDCCDLQVRHCWKMPTSHFSRKALPLFDRIVTDNEDTLTYGTVNVGLGRTLNECEDRIFARPSKSLSEFCQQQKVNLNDKSIGPIHRMLPGQTIVDCVDSEPTFIKLNREEEGGVGGGAAPS
ncbi:hypothetical protein C7M84_021639 [Penaeus vannamei]|uniref:Uncharacterized protein n=1 Tax=Penaeus vannamei TaxID=6689 RepID=A0A3R7NKH7_PENVA|nr:hypothetical protein C7M84_021639 [Penaeus vannamei]